MAKLTPSFLTIFGHRCYLDFLKSMMRQDPDVLMLGEIRDKASTEAIIQAALTGHKVFSTFHTEETTGALLRMMDMGIDTFLISTTVMSVIAQRLVRVLCPHCKQVDEVTDKMRATFNSISGIDTKKHPIYKKVGCSRCNGIGYKGRIAVHEILVVNSHIRDAILARRPSNEIRAIARSEKCLVTMREDGFYKCLEGLTTPEEIARAVFYSETDAENKIDADDLLGWCENTEDYKERYS